MQVPIFLSQIWSRDVPAAWPVTNTWFANQNMKPGIYLRLGWSQVPVFPPKIWSQACTWGVAGRRYFITHPKHEVQHIPATGTCFPTQNMKRDMYRRHSRLQVPDLPPKVWNARCTCGPSGRKYLFSHLNCEGQHVLRLIWVQEKQLVKQVVRPVICTCFRFFAYENRSTEAAVPAAGLFYLIYP